MAEVTVSLYEGMRFDDVYEMSNPREIKMAILTGKTARCLGCDKIKLVTFFNGVWLCYSCIKQEAEEMEYQEQYEPEEDPDEKR